MATVAPDPLKVRSLAELVALVRAQPAHLNWATTTGYSDFLFAAFLKNAGLVMSKVPYRDTAQASSALGESCIQMYWGSLAIVRPQLQARKPRLLCISNGVWSSAEPGRHNPS